MIEEKFISVSFTSAFFIFSSYDPDVKDNNIKDRSFQKPLPTKGKFGNIEQTHRKGWLSKDLKDIRFILLSTCFQDKNKKEAHDIERKRKIYNIFKGKTITKPKQTRN